MIRSKGEEVRESATYAKAKDGARGQAEQGRVPRLRFPEFKSTGEWETKQLDQIASLVDDRVIGRTLVPLSVMSGVGLIPQTEKFGREIAGNQYKNYTAIKKFDFAYNKSSTKQYPEGFIAMLEDYETAAVPPSIFTCFRITDSGASPFFLKHIFYANFHGNWLRKYIAVGARAHGSLTVDDSDLFKFPICLPGYPEQKKIAAFLFSLDHLIAVHARKLDALRRYKKGLMQQLFPAEGKSVPQLRFPEFRDSPSWIRKSINELVDTQVIFSPRDGNHGNLHPKSSDYTDHGIPFIMASDLNEGEINYKNCAYIPKELADTLQKGFSREGDVLLTHKGTVGEIAIVGKTDFPYIMLTPQVTYYRVRDHEQLSNLYLATVFCTNGFQENMIASSGGGTRSYIGITEQGKLNITITAVRLKFEFFKNQLIC